MRSIIKVLLTALAVVLLAKLLPGVAVDGYITAIIVAIVLALLKFIVRPILIILTLPITLITFGLFLFVINALILLIADYFIGGFQVGGIFIAILFSVLLSLFQSILFSLIKDDQK